MTDLLSFWSESILDFDSIALSLVQLKGKIENSIKNLLIVN